MQALKKDNENLQRAHDGLLYTNRRLQGEINEMDSENRRLTNTVAEVFLLSAPGQLCLCLWIILIHISFRRMRRSLDAGQSWMTSKVSTWTIVAEQMHIYCLTTILSKISIDFINDYNWCLSLWFRINYESKAWTHYWRKGEKIPEFFPNSHHPAN